MKSLPLLLFALTITAAGAGAHAACPIHVMGAPGEVGFGTAIAYPGDLNGDGWNDVVVGAASAGAEGAAVTGRAYVYFGGPGFDPTADVVLA